MSEQPRDAPIRPVRGLTIGELARLQHAEEVRDVRELAADIWESQEELDEFLADLRAARNASLG